jgi:hypothetical protein
MLDGHRRAFDVLVSSFYFLVVAALGCASRISIIASASGR